MGSLGGSKAKVLVLPRNRGRSGFRVCGVGCCKSSKRVPYGVLRRLHRGVFQGLCRGWGLGRCRDLFAEYSRQGFFLSYTIMGTNQTKTNQAPSPQPTIRNPQTNRKSQQKATSLRTSRTRIRQSGLGIFTQGPRFPLKALEPSSPKTPTESCNNSLESLKSTPKQQAPNPSQYVQALKTQCPNSKVRPHP